MTTSDRSGATPYVRAALIGGALAGLWFVVLPTWLALLMTIVSSTVVGFVTRVQLDRRADAEGTSGEHRV